MDYFTKCTVSALKEKLHKFVAAALLAAALIPGTAFATLIVPLANFSLNTAVDTTFGFTVTAMQSAGGTNADGVRVDNGGSATFYFSPAAFLEGFEVKNANNDGFTWNGIAENLGPNGNPGQVSVNMVLGSLTVAGTSGTRFRISRLFFADEPVASVPEPGTLALLGLGLLGIGLARRKRA